MENIITFVQNNKTLAIELWCVIGFAFYWISIFMKQIFYWINNKEVSPFFFPLEDKEDYFSAFVFSIMASFLGFVGLFFIIIAIKVMKDESERLGYLSFKRP